MDNSEIVGDGYVKLPSVWPGVVDEIPQEFNRDMRGFYSDAWSNTCAFYYNYHLTLHFFTDIHYYNE